MDEMSSENVSLRDYLAVHATEDDIAQQVAKIRPVERVRTEGGFSRVVRGAPDNARQLARYMHAVCMLAARGIKTS